MGRIRRIVTTMTALPDVGRPRKLGVLVRQPPLVAHRAESLEGFAPQLLTGPDELAAVWKEIQAVFT